MVLTQRERYIAIGAATLLGVAIISWALTRYVEARRDITDGIHTREREVTGIKYTYNERDRLSKAFKQMIDDGLKNSQADAKGQVRDALEQWAPSSGVNEKTLNDGQIVHEGDFDQINFKLSGWGPMATIARLLNQCETTTLPLRVTKIVINPVAEAKDYLYFELTVSTICRSEKEKPGRARASAGWVPSSGDRL